MKGVVAALFAALMSIGVVAAPPAAAQEPPAFQELFHWVDWLADKYGTGTIWVSHEYMEYGVYGKSRGNEIVFSSDYVYNPDELHYDMSSDVAHGFHPGERCSAIQILAAHEFAHVVDYIGGYTAQYELEYAVESGMSGEVSGYSFHQDGSVNYPEALADAFVAVECDDPTPAEQAIYEMLTT